MKVQRLIVPLALACVVASPSLTQEVVESKAARLTGVSWTKEGTYEWNRPEKVRYVLLRACGGGGGGAGGISFSRDPKPRADGGTATGGGGGAGAFVTTTLLGPLAAASYTVVIGRGGVGGDSTFATSASGADVGDRVGQPGMPTSFTGSDVSFETPGAVGGAAAHPGTRFSEVQNNYEYFVMGVPNSGGAYPGGGSSQNGARGLLGLGGPASQQGFAGGGGGSLGNGGAAGDIDRGGADGGACAGGGGAGFLRNKESKSAGGRGGSGSLTLVSVAGTPEQN